MSKAYDYEVLIAGGGPTGLMLAAELQLAGIDVALVERRTDQGLPGSRAGGLHTRTIETFDMRGVAERFLSQGTTMQIVGFNMIRLDMSDFPTRHPYGLALKQNITEQIMHEWVTEIGVKQYRGEVVSGFEQDNDGVDLNLESGKTLRARYLVGCDGGRSIIRKQAEIEFAGWDATTSWIIAEVEMTEEPVLGFKNDAAGAHAMSRAENGTSVGIVITEATVLSGTPTLEELKQALIKIYGTDFGVHSPTWLSRFSDATRQAVNYRQGRVLLAGDAAHIHPPIGGQGLNIGVQDAMNLGWKLAQVVKNISPDSLLDTYHDERYPVGARVLRTTMAQVAMRRTDERTKALNETLAEVITLDQPRKKLAAELSGLGVHYDLGDGHPLLGRRMPDLEVTTSEGPLRVFTLLHQAKAALINLGGASVEIGSWSEQVQLVNAKYDGEWELPAIGKIAGPTAVLVRPDGYVAWVGENDQTAGLQKSLIKWFGPKT